MFPFAFIYIGLIVLFITPHNFLYKNLSKNKLFVHLRNGGLYYLNKKGFKWYTQGRKYSSTTHPAKESDLTLLKHK